MEETKEGPDGFDGETLDAIYLLLLAVPISRMANGLTAYAAQGDNSEYEAILKQEASLKN